MNILFDINHPAQFHLFRNFYNFLKSKNIQVTMTIRDRDFTKILCELYNINYKILSIAESGLLGFSKEYLIKETNLIKLQNREKFNIGFGTSLFLSHLSALFKFKDFNFIEDDDKWVTFHRITSYPFAYRIVIPNCLKYEKWGKKRIKHNSYHELAYLHPNQFTPDIDILKKYSLKPKEYVIIRFSALKAYHDFNVKGIDKETYKEIKNVVSQYDIVESVENNKTHSINPKDMHDILFYSKMLITDSQTMTMEASVLGIPSVRINSHVGKISVLDGELMNKYKLTYGYLPDSSNLAINRIKNLINNTELDDIWVEKRKIMLNEKDDMLEWMIDRFNNEWIKL